MLLAKSGHHGRADDKIVRATSPMLAGYTPDVVCLLALQSAILSGNTAHNIILEERPEYLDRLYAPYHMDRRAELPPGEPPTMAVPVFAYDGQLAVRYLRLYITKGHEVAGAPLTLADTDPLDFLDDVMRRSHLPGHLPDGMRGYGVREQCVHSA